jgi:hypothetical protein
MAEQDQLDIYSLNKGGGSVAEVGRSTHEVYVFQPGPDFLPPIT